MRTLQEPVTKVTINLFTKDLAWFRSRFPFNYSEEIRNVLRHHIAHTKAWENLKDDE